MTKDQNFDLFWGPKWPKSWPSGAHILHTTKSTGNEHVKQYWCQSSENFLRKWTKTGIFTYFEAENGPKIELLRPIFYTHIKVVTMSMWNNTDVKPMETLRKWLKTTILYIFGGPKFGPLRPILHISLKVTPMSIYKARLLWIHAWLKQVVW